MPLVFFDGLRVCCYVGGVGGKMYLHQAKYVAENMGIIFPPVVVWRPRDNYFGVAQLEALMICGKLSGIFDISQLLAVEDRLNEKIADVQKKIDALYCYETQKYRDYLNEETIWFQVGIRGLQIGEKYAEVFELTRWRL